MFSRHDMPDDHWDRLRHLLPGQAGGHGGVGGDTRRFLDAVLGIARTGAPRRDLPERLGDWNSPWRRFGRRGGVLPVATGAWRRGPSPAIRIASVVVPAPAPAASGGARPPASAPAPG